MDRLGKPPHYRSYLLRLWAEGEPPVWRFSLEDPHTGERRGLANLNALVEFIKEVMAQIHKDSSQQRSG